jgi:Skp family chaperone for outer membrane proteins
MKGSTVAVGVVAAVVLAALGFLLGQATQRGDTGWESAAQELSAQVETLSQSVEAFQAQIAGLEQKVDALEGQLASLASQGAASPASISPGETLKIAYVDMFRVLQELQDSELVKQALAQFREEQARIRQQEEDLQKQFNEGKISKKELDEKLFELEMRLREINLQLSAPIQRQMLEIIRQIGQEKGYGLIIDNPASQLNAIVLYSQSGQADDITQAVIERMKAQLETQSEGQSSGDGESSQ